MRRSRRGRCTTDFGMRGRYPVNPSQLIAAFFPVMAERPCGQATRPPILHHPVPSTGTIRTCAPSVEATNCDSHLKRYINSSIRNLFGFLDGGFTTILCIQTRQKRENKGTHSPLSLLARGKRPMEERSSPHVLLTRSRIGTVSWWLDRAFFT